MYLVGLAVPLRPQCAWPYQSNAYGCVTAESTTSPGAVYVESEDAGVCQGRRREREGRREGRREGEREGGSGRVSTSPSSRTIRTDSEEREQETHGGCPSCRRRRHWRRRSCEGDEEASQRDRPCERTPTRGAATTTTRGSGTHRTWWRFWHTTKVRAGLHLGSIALNARLSCVTSSCTTGANWPSCEHSKREVLASCAR